MIGGPRPGGGLLVLLTGARRAAAGHRRHGGRPLAGGIAKVWLDGKVKADLADTTAQIGAPEVWAGGDTGQGVDVAVLDTGVDAAHPRPRRPDRRDGRASCPDQDVTDRNGHGTHVASTIAGTGAASGGTEKGVAPGATLHIGKVLGQRRQRPGLLDPRRHGVGRPRPARQGRQHEPGRRPHRRHRPAQPGRRTGSARRPGRCSSSRRATPARRRAPWARPAPRTPR